MEMKNVKKITLPNKVPVYDTDYRQLGYIHFSGNERISFTNSNIVSQYARNTVRFKQTGSSVGDCVLGDHDYANDVHYDITNYETSGNNRLVYAQATIFQSGSIELYNSSATETIHVVQIDNYEGKIYLNGALKYTAASIQTKTSSVFSLGCATRKTSTTTSYEDYWTGNIFSFSPGIYNSNTGWEDTLYVPAQRKSDNVCGLYCMKNNTFYPMTGTEITTNAAGNIVAEEGILLRYDDIDVKKIENSNGDIIWGSYAEFPYRRLEYIHFNGNDYIDTGFTPWNNFSFTIDVKWDSGQKNQYMGHGRVTSNNRAFIGVDANSLITYGSGQASGTISGTDPYNRHIYNVRTGSGSNLGVFDIDGVQKWYGTSAFQESNRGTMFIGGVYRSTGDYSLCKANLYKADFLNTPATATIPYTWRLIPCQRKSDGVIGLLKLKGSGAAPDFMTSVNGLLEAGPTADEYWDLTDPF